MSTSDPNLDQWLESLGLKHIKNALIEFGVSTPTDLAMLRETYRQVLIEDLKLSPKLEIKLRIAINKLDLYIKRDKVVVITQQEDKSMKELQTRLNDAQKLLQETQTLSHENKEIAEIARAAVKNDFDKLFEALTNRKKFLMDEIDKEERDAQRDFDACIQKQSLIVNELADVKVESDHLLANTAVDENARGVPTKVKEILGSTQLKKCTTDPKIIYKLNLQKVLKDLSDAGRISRGKKPEPPIIKGHECTSNSISFTVEAQKAHNNDEKLKITQFVATISESESKIVEGKEDFVSEKIFDASKNVFLIDGLKTATEYRIKVKAKNSFGRSEGSKDLLLKTSVPKIVAKAVSGTGAPQPGDSHVSGKKGRRVNDRNAVKENWRDFEVGDILDCKDSQKKWYQSEILDIKDDLSQIFIHYLGFLSKWDEWIDTSDAAGRVAKQFTHTNGQHKPIITKVEIKDHRGHRGDHKPQHLFKRDICYYESEFVSKFGDNECDWIIFDLQKVWYLSTLLIKNRDNGIKSGVKDFDVMISKDNVSWEHVATLQLQSLPKASNKEQSFDFDIDTCTGQYVKLEFLTNYDSKNKVKGAYPFSLFHVRFMGYELMYKKL